MFNKASRTKDIIDIFKLDRMRERLWEVCLVKSHRY